MGLMVCDNNFMSYDRIISMPILAISLLYLYFMATKYHSKYPTRRHCVGAGFISGHQIITLFYIFVK